MGSKQESQEWTICSRIRRYASKVYLASTEPINWWASWIMEIGRSSTNEVSTESGKRDEINLNKD